MLCTFVPNEIAAGSAFRFVFSSSVSVSVLTPESRQHQISWLQVSVQTFSQAFASAKEQLARSLLK